MSRFSFLLSLLSVSALLCFLSLHIVGNLTSKFPSIIYILNYFIFKYNIVVFDILHLIFYN